MIKILDIEMNKLIKKDKPASYYIIRNMNKFFIDIVFYTQLS